jgi:DNA-binding GntR family transcriptional regulator
LPTSRFDDIEGFHSGERSASLRHDEMTVTNSGTARNQRGARKAKGKGPTLSLSEQAYIAIKDRIITLFFAPGQYLNEASICEQLGMGRTPVHQALQRLQADGLVDIVPRKGVIIQPDSMGQVLEILDARLVVEPEIAARAAEHHRSEDVADIRALLDHHRDDPHGGGRIDSFVECDRAFHNKLSDLSQSRILGEFAKSLHERSTRAWYLHLWQTLDTEASDRQHRAVLAAIEARDPAAAAAAMREHLAALRDKVVHLQRQAPRRAPAAQPR